MATPKKNKEVEDTKSEETPAEKRRPIHTIREGEINLSVWSRQHEIRGETRTFYSVSIERCYKDRMGQYQYTRNFDPESLDKLVSAVQRASEYLHSIMNPDSMLPGEEVQA